MAETTTTHVPSLALNYEGRVLVSIGIGGEMYRREVLADRVVTSDGITGHCECGGCGGTIGPYDAYCKHCGAFFGEMGIEADG